MNTNAVSFIDRSCSVYNPKTHLLRHWTCQVSGDYLMN